jgi:hypothetical protein
MLYLLHREGTLTLPTQTARLVRSKKPRSEISDDRIGERDD